MRQDACNSVRGLGVAAKAWRIGVAAGLFATLPLFPLIAGASSAQQPATAKPVSSATDLSDATRIVKMSDDDPMYQPNSIQIHAGQSVEWQNTGQVSHSVTDDPNLASNPLDALVPLGAHPFNSGSVMPGGSYRHLFTQPGRYRYFCLTHEIDHMVGEVIVQGAAPEKSAEHSSQWRTLGSLSSGAH